MNKWMVVVTLSMSLVATAARSAQAQTGDAQFRSDVERLLQVTGAAALGAQVANIMSEQMFQGLKQVQPEIPDRVLTLLREVLAEEFAGMFSGPSSIQPAVVDLYIKHFTHDDVRMLLDFYGSPVGRKAIQVLPVLTRESAAVGQKWAEAHMPRIMGIAEQRLRAEGFLR